MRGLDMTGGTCPGTGSYPILYKVHRWTLAYIAFNQGLLQEHA